MAGPLCKGLFVLAGFLCVVGIVLVVVGSRNQFVEKTEYALTVVDAGGSGTRLIVYKLIDDLVEQRVECEGKGLGNWKTEEFPILEKKLEACYKTGQTFLPEGSSNTPIYFGATAGMRVLKLRDPASYDTIWNMVRKTLNTTDYDVKWADVFPGRYEAEFSWIAANILSKGFVTNDIQGMAETGSSSVQIAFPVDEATDPAKHIYPVDIEGKKMSVYEYSYLCYGESEAWRRFHALLIKDSGYSTGIVEDPCTNAGFNWTRTSKFLWNVPCVKGDYAKDMFGYSIDGPSENDNQTYHLRGTSQPEKCLNLLKQMISTNCTNNTTCGLNDVLQPEVHGKFMALSSFYYSTHYMGLPYNGQKEEYWEKTKKLCNTPFNEMTPPYEEENSKYKSKQCWDSIFTYFLLSEGFKFDKDNWNIEYIKKINGKSADWSLGVAYRNKENAYQHQVDVSQPKYKALFISGIVLIVLSIVFIIAGIIVCKKDSNSYDSI